MSNKFCGWIRRSHIKSGCYSATTKRYMIRIFVKRKLQRKRACGQHADRNQQFEIITNKKTTFEENQQPVISIDTKKRTFRTTLS